jgi:hypothetical protein
MRLVPLTRAERSQLYDKLTDWYYDDGNGMLLTPATRNIYLKAKKNLTCPPEELVPESLVEQAAHDDGDTVRGQASIDQLSLLRTSMRADIRIYTQPYDEELSTEDIAFLEASNVDVHRDPWRGTRASGSPCITTRSSKSFCWAGERPTSSAAEEAHGGLFGFYLEKIPLSPQKIDEVMQDDEYRRRLVG